MLNSVGLQGDGVKMWLADELPSIERHERSRRRQHLGSHDRRLPRRRPRCSATAPASVVAVEVNLSCPNLHGHTMFAQLRDRRGVGDRRGHERRAVCRCGPSSPRRSPTSCRSPTAVRDAGADAVTLINTLPGMVLDTERRAAAARGRGGGGLSGPAIHPVAVRAVYDVHHALPDLPIVGVGGVADAASRRRADAGRRGGRAGRHGDLRRSASHHARARRTRCLVRRAWRTNDHRTHRRRTS